MARLAPAVRRALAEATASTERVRQKAQIARLNRVLRMLSGVNGLVLQTRDRTAVLRETCRLATSIGGYAAAIAVTRVSGSVTMQPVVWNGRRSTRNRRAVQLHIGVAGARVQRAEPRREFRHGVRLQQHRTARRDHDVRVAAAACRHAVGGGAAAAGRQRDRRPARADVARRRHHQRRRAGHAARGGRQPLVRPAVPAARLHGAVPVAFRSADRPCEAAAVLRARAAHDRRACGRQAALRRDRHRRRSAQPHQRHDRPPRRPTCCCSTSPTGSGSSCLVRTSSGISAAAPSRWCARRASARSSRSMRPATGRRTGCSASRS